MSKKKIAFSWYGGKTSHLKWLLPIIDNTPHTTYVESFGGSAAVLLNKQISPIEVYNDIYSDVVNFFSVLRDQSEQLIPLLELTPFSREEFAESCTTNPDDSPLERARKFFVRARQVRTGLATTASPGRWAYEIIQSRCNMSASVSRWLGSIQGLEEICIRLKSVQLENLDALDIIGRYDSNHALHYMDPPYLMSTRSGGTGYSNEMDEKKHSELLKLILNLKGKVILSGYENTLYNDALKSWNKYAAEATYAASTRQHGKAQLRQEIIWTNYNLNEVLPTLPVVQIY